MTETKPIGATAGHYQAVEKDTLIFDSHEYVKRMTDGGFNEQQAETLAAEQGDLLSNLATRQDIETVRQDIETVKDDLDVVKNDLEVVKGDLDVVKNDLEVVKGDLEVVKGDLEVVKGDLEVVKNDLEEVKKNMVTKDDLEEVKKNMVTKDDLKNILENYATKDDLKNFATKQDVEVSAQTLKVEMIKWMTWYFLSGLAVMVAVLKLT